MSQTINSQPEPTAELSDLRARLEEAEATLRAIRDSSVDAFMMEGPSGQRIVALPGADSPYRVMVQSLNEGALTLLADGTLAYCNPRFATMVQKPADELIGTAFQLLLAPSQRPAFGALLSQMRQAPARGEFQLLRPDGRPLAVQLSGQPLGTSASEVEAVILVATDLTERLRAEAQVRFQSQLLAAVGQAVIATDQDGRISFWNPAAEALYGWPAAEVLGRPVIDVTVSHASQAQGAEIMASLAAGQSWSGEFDVQRRDGTTFPAYITDSLVRDAAGQIIGVIGVSMDISARKQAEEALRESEQHLRLAVATVNMAVFNQDRDLRYTWMYQRQRWYTAGPLIGLTDAELVPGSFMEPTLQVKRRVIETGIGAREEVSLTIGEVTTHFDLTLEPLRDEHGRVVGLVGAALDITERKQAEAALRASEKSYRELFENSIAGIVQVHPDGRRLLRVNLAFARMYGYSSPEEMIAEVTDVSRQIYAQPRDREALGQGFGALGGSAPQEVEVVRRDGTHFFVLVAVQRVQDASGAVLYYQSTHSDVTARKQAELEVQHRLAELESVQHISMALRASTTVDEMLPLLLDETLAVLGAEAAAIWMLDPAHLKMQLAIARGWYRQLETRPVTNVDGGIAARLLETRQPYVSREFASDPLTAEAQRPRILAGWGGAAVPILSGPQVIGLMQVGVQLPRELQPQEVHLLTTLCEIAGSAIQRSALHEETGRRLHHLAALSEIDRAIMSSFDLNVVLAVLVDKAMTELALDAADVLLLNAAGGKLHYAAGMGFRGQDIQSSELRLGVGYAGRAALERHLVHVANLVQDNTSPRLAKILGREGFVVYYGVPLIAKGQVKGVLEVFLRAPREPDADWLAFLDALAGQAAIAIDNITLFSDLQRSNTDLTLAYDRTIEGWSRALDLRDKETEGHSLRVTDLAVRLGRQLGLSEAALAQVRWGALLHDIGKMGIPDRVLLKPGPLTDDEWVLMKQHPDFAYQMLAPISHLREALDIPYCHHEKWDGSGYPRGLSGEQIPLAARAFAVVDVWDALTSDRPYRPAWPAAETRRHIQSLSGTHFDPQMVRVAFAARLFDPPAPA